MQPLFVLMKTNENKSYENSKLNSKAKNLQLENNTMYYIHTRQTNRFVVKQYFKTLLQCTTNTANYVQL